ncbi:MAG: hypothetical protein Q9219_003517 [cf. Caloplaca sp. 3 TL-2023]
MSDADAPPAAIEATPIHSLERRRVDALKILSLGQYGAEYVAIGKGLGRPLDVLLQSPDLLSLNKAIAAFDSISEFLMLAVPIDLIWSLQMPSRRKIGIITAFYVRIPVFALTLVRNHYVHELLEDPDTGLVARTVVIWQEAELAYSIAAATLMCLKPLVKDFNTSFGLGGDMVRTHGATGYIASNENGSQGIASKLQKLRAYGSGSRYGKGSVIEMDSRGGGRDEFPPANTHDVYVSERRLNERPNIGPHPDSKMSTTVSHDPDHRTHDSTGSRGPDDIVVTHRVEQSVHPRNMV